MNSLVYNPNIQHIEEWSPVYLSQKIITPFQNIIERTCSYLSVISNNKLKRSISLNSTGSNLVQQDLNSKPKLGKLKTKISIREERGIQRLSDQIIELKDRFEQQYKVIFGKYVQNEQNSRQKVHDSFQNISAENNKIKDKIDICEQHLRQLKTKGFAFYDQFVDQEGEMLETFVSYKLAQLRAKFQKVSSFLSQQQILSQHPKEREELRVLFDNLYIQTDYLRIFTHKNTLIYEMHAQNQYSSEDPQMIKIRKRQLKRLKKCEEQIEALKKDIRELYFQHFRKKKGKEIKDHYKLQTYIRNEIAVNKANFEPEDSFNIWFHGFIFAILLISLCGIIIFRETNIVYLQQHEDYAVQFQVWRGASYLISFNWVLAFLTYLYQRLGINYRMILLEENKYLERPQSFFWSASVLSAVYLVLFLVYLLKQLNYIVGFDHLNNLGYYMWGINIVFMLNPFKILNYHSRIYFMDVLLKNLQLMWRPINFNLFLLGMIMGSCVQPLNDFAFTSCQLIYNHKETCIEQGRFATFIYLLIYIFYRVIQSFRLHHQYSPDVCISRARQGLTACIFSLNTVVSSYLYGTYKTTELMNYWIISASISTIIGTNADLRADWGVISLDKEDCLLRKYKMFKRWIYFFCAGLDLLLNVVWALTISTEIADYLNINSLYFFLLLQNLEFCRRGMWMLFRIEDDHMQNVGALNAMADDSSLIKHLEEMTKQVKAKQRPKQINDTQVQMQQQNHKPNLTLQFQVVEQPQILLQSNIKNQSNPKQQSTKDRESSLVIDLSKLQELVVKKQEKMVKVQNFISALEGYLGIIHELYQRLQWEDQY